ncbi:skin secretory protein xP2 [Enoplosus armatus]|uniref:skin secretory protein xP2 n=1 Tax=Enoplosus armatus TaxID=215367 RepID=UPI0039933C5D
MMSYLWILLLGSLLAASAKAQDDGAPTEEAAAPGTLAPEADAAPEINGEPAADEEAPHTDEKIPPTVSEPEATADPAAGAEEAVTSSDGDAEAVTPAGGDVEAVTPAGGDAEAVTPAGGDAEAVTPAGGDAEAVTPAGGDAEAVTPAGDAEAVTPAAADTEAEAAATTQGPAADPEVKDTEAEQPTATGEEEPASSTGATPAQEEATPASGPTAADHDEEPTDPAVDAEQTEKLAPVLDPTIKVEVAAPEVNSGFNLEDALTGGTVEDNPAESGKSPAFESEAHVAGATGDDKPEAQEASSGSLAGILGAVCVAMLGAVAGYFTYQKKKLCFKNREEADPEAARKADAAEAQSDPQVLSNLLNSS